MITKPPIDELTEKAGDKYALCCVIAKRSKELNCNLDQLPQNVKPISYAADEFYEGMTEIKQQI